MNRQVSICAPKAIATKSWKEKYGQLPRTFANEALILAGRLGPLIDQPYHLLIPLIDWTNLEPHLWLVRVVWVMLFVLVRLTARQQKPGKRRRASSARKAAVKMPTKPKNAKRPRKRRSPA